MSIIGKEVQQREADRAQALRNKRLVDFDRAQRAEAMLEKLTHPYGGDHSYEDAVSIMKATDPEMYRDLMLGRTDRMNEYQAGISPIGRSQAIEAMMGQRIASAPTRDSSGERVLANLSNVKRANPQAVEPVLEHAVRQGVLSPERALEAQYEQGINVPRQEGGLVRF